MSAKDREVTISLTRGQCRGFRPYFGFTKRWTHEVRKIYVEAIRDVGIATVSLNSYLCRR